MLAYERPSSSICAGAPLLNLRETQVPGPHHVFARHRLKNGLDLVVAFDLRDDPSVAVIDEQKGHQDLNVPERRGMKRGGLLSAGAGALC